VIGTVDAVGRTFRSNNREVEVIGVVEDGKYRSLTESPLLSVFLPRRQVNDTNVTVLVRSDLPPEQIVRQVRAAIAAIDGRVPILYEGPVRDVMSLAFLPSNAAGVALTAFGLIALVLALTGVYSLAAVAVSRRTREIGIRVAVGARRHHVLRAVLGRTATCVLSGGLAGLVAGTMTSQFLVTVLYGATVQDPAVIITVVVLIGAVALAAALAPVRRALSIEPAAALREG
jgi:hypothetical protein